MIKLASAAVMKPAQAVGFPHGTSAAGVLSLLDEEDDSLKVHALQQLDSTVDEFWFQIAGSIAAIEALYEDEEFEHRGLAALVASKVSIIDLPPTTCLSTSPSLLPLRPSPRFSSWPAGVLPPGRPR